jgi:hypothetical protein
MRLKSHRSLRHGTRQRAERRSIGAAGSGQLRQVGTCPTPAGDHVTATVHDRHGGSGDGLKMFAGLTSDPFIFQFEWIVETLKTGHIASSKIGIAALDAVVPGLLKESRILVKRR